MNTKKEPIFKDLVLNFFEMTKKQMIEKHEFMPLAIPFSYFNEDEEKEFEPMPFLFDDDFDKVQLSFATGVRCRFKGAPALILVNQGFGKTWKTEEERKYIEENWNTERPTTYPKSMRINYLLINFVDFLDPKDSVTLVSQYYEKENGEIFFDTPKIETEVISAITGSMMNGWNFMDKLFEDENED